MWAVEHHTCTDSAVCQSRRQFVRFACVDGHPQGPYPEHFPEIPIPSAESRSVLHVKTVPVLLVKLIRGHLTVCTPNL